MRSPCIAFLAAAVLAIAGCTATCEDACERLAECAAEISLLVDEAACVAECEATVCADKDTALDCLDGIDCQPDELTLEITFAACLASGACD